MGGPIDCFNCGGTDPRLTLVRSCALLCALARRRFGGGDHFARDCPEGGKGKGYKEGKGKSKARAPPRGSCFREGRNTRAACDSALRRALRRGR
jgi:hypothetical protein